MDVEQIFQEFINNLTVENQESIEHQFAKVTKRLNTDFHELDSNSENGLYIGSYGRNTAIKGISDLDMIFELPKTLFSKYDNREGNKQSQLLQDVKESLIKSYSQSKVRGDGQVVVVEFTKDYIEVCPAFRESDNTFTYPDSREGGKWKKTNPIPEAETSIDYNEECNGNFVNLCRIVRAWKNKCGVKINGLLIDTFVFDFFKQNEEYKSYKFEDYDNLVENFFYYLKEKDDNRVYWYALGSNQKVYKKKSNFKSKAKKAYKNIKEAIEKNENKTVYEIWRKVFGKAFPYPKLEQEKSYNYTFQEQYIEDQYPLDIKNTLRIDCEVKQDGFRTQLLRDIFFLSKNKNLRFFISNTNVIAPYEVLWKVKNEGELANKRQMLRGQIEESNLNETERKESSSFEGAHFVECYIIKDGFCVARDRIDVPISDG